MKEIVTLVHKEMGKNVPDNCFGTAERTDVGMKYLALNGNKLFDSIGYVSTVGIQDVLNLY